MAYDWNVPTAMDAMDRRRQRWGPTEWGDSGTVGLDAGSNPGGQANSYLGGGTFASTGDTMLDTIRNTTMADAAARSRGARFSAMSASPNDPSLSAYAGLEGLLSGQGDAATALNRGALGRLSQIDARKWQEYIMRLRRQWEEEDARRAEKAALWGDLAGLGGAALGAAF